MTFNVTILGSNSAIPTAKRHPTSQLLNVREQFYLIDCGEGTQIQLRRNRLKMQRINHIFISHLHGDHFFGLIGLLTTLNLLGRQKELHVYGPKDLEEIIRIQLKYADVFLHFSLIFHHIEPVSGKKIFENDLLTVQTIEMKHRIPCCGFLFREKPKPRKMLKEALAKYKIPIKAIESIKQGADFTTKEGEVIKNEKMTEAPPPSKSYAYCTDTAFEEKIIPYIKNADLLYHEATFLKKLEKRAKETYHSTTVQAAQIAKMAGVKKLLLGHYSARYKKLEDFEQEAREVFENTEAVVEGRQYKV